MAPVQIASAYVPISGDDNPLRRTLTGVRNLLKNFVGNVVQGIGQGIGQALFNTINRGIKAGVELIKTSIKASSNLSESLSKTVVAFGQSAKAIVDWSKTSDTAFGQSQQQSLEAASSFGLLFNTIGIGNKEAAEMSIRLVELASDIASINNLEPEEALVKLRAGLVGEVEPLRTVGVLLNATAVEQEALTSGLAATKDAITEQDKVMARYQLILKQTTKTQGDFARTSQGIANQERILAAQRQNALAQIGAAFAPIYLVILQNINRVINQISPYGENIIRRLAEGMVNGIIYILPALRVVKDVITYWLKPGSPPRILPDLDVWGKDAMSVYLKGWSDADFGVLSTLGQTIEGIVRSFVTSGGIPEEDIVQRVFGTRRAILSAVSMWRNAGSITSGAIQDIETAAGPAGTALAGLVRSFFDMEGASRRASQAQKELNDVTESYDRLLNPLNEQLDAINDKEQEIRDRQARSEARRTLRDPRATANEKRLATLELERIQLSSQIDTIEDEKRVATNAAQEKLKASQKELEVATAIYNAQKALLDQTVETNRLVGEQNELNKKRADEAERVYQAALDYNLAIADTPGKIALLNLELARQKEGSVEYYQILTQIAGLQKSLAEEQGQGSIIPEDSVLPSLDELGIPDWANDLSKRLDTAIKQAFGVGPTSPQIADQFLGGLDVFGKDIGPEGNKAPEVSQQVKDFVGVLKDLTAAVVGVTPPLQLLAELFGFNAEESDKAGQKIEDDTESHLSAAAAEMKFWTKILEQDWDGAWLAMVEYSKTQQEGSAAKFVVWLHDMSDLLGLITALMQGNWGAAWLYFTKVSDEQEDEISLNLGGWLSGLDETIRGWDLFGAGKALIGSLWDGMTEKWGELKDWFTTKLQGLSDLLPGSEPKDRSSPLANLPKRGKALIENLQSGMDSTSLQLGSPNLDLLSAGAAAGGGGFGRSINIAEGAFVFSGIDPNAPVMPDARAMIKKFLEDLDGDS